jgi:tetratricopeptide (TPR) repeat protein
LTADPRQGDLAELAGAVRDLLSRDEVDAAVEMVASTWRAWMAAGEIAAGRKLLAEVLDVPGGRSSAARSRALYGDGVLAFRAGDRHGSLARNQAAQAVARELSDRELEAQAMVGLSRIALRDGKYDQVCDISRQALDLVEGLQPGAMVMPLHLLAAGTRLGGDLDMALGLYSQSLELNRQLGDERMVAAELHNIGHVELRRGHPEVAQNVFAECWGRRDPEDAYDAAMTSLNQAALAFDRWDVAAAAELLAKSTTLLAEAGMELDPDDRFEVEDLRRRLG